MSDLREIYQDIILDHYRKPRNYSELEAASHEANGHNPLCGDRVQVYLRIRDDVVEEATFKGAGCAISTASASLMTEAIRGLPLDQVKNLFDRFHMMVTAREETTSPDLGKLEALSGVRKLPVRVKCATLAWHTLQAAIENSVEQTVTTES